MMLAVLTLAGCAAPAPMPSESSARGAPTLAEPGLAGELVMTSLSLVGTGYTYGGRDPETGFDCSGMVSYIYEQVAGIRLPHNAAAIASVTRPIDRQALTPGDLVFFDTLNRPFSHMGIYVGDGRFVHAASGGGRVKTSRLANRYYARRYQAARRVLVH